MSKESEKSSSTHTHTISLGFMPTATGFSTTIFPASSYTITTGASTTHTLGYGTRPYLSTPFTSIATISIFAVDRYGHIIELVKDYAGTLYSYAQSGLIDPYLDEQHIFLVIDNTGMAHHGLYEIDPSSYEATLTTL